MTSTEPLHTQPLRTVAGIPTAHAGAAIELLEARLVALIDLDLTLKHVHWNVVGPTFISVHEMLDGFVAEVRPMVDDLAERMRTLGGVARGTPGHVVATRTWTDYDLDQAPASNHLRALDDVYDAIVLDHRRAIAHVAELDPVTEDLLIGQTAALEKMQWFVRSFLHSEQPDANETRFGREDRMPTPDEEQAADTAGTVSDTTRAAYREMAETGANVRGEGAIG